MSKLQTSIDIVKANPDKKIALAAIQEALGVTRANASVYLFKAKKAIDSEGSGYTAPVVEEVKEPEVDRNYSSEQQQEYNDAMEHRASQGHSKMSINEYFDMMENLQAIA
jgi:hypothetical protein